MHGHAWLLQLQRLLLLARAAGLLLVQRPPLLLLLVEVSPLLPLVLLVTPLPFLELLQQRQLPPSMLFPQLLGGGQ